MNRQIITLKDLTNKNHPGNSYFENNNNPISDNEQDPSFHSQQKDDYFNRLLKYIPAEIIGLYITLSNIVATQESKQTILITIVFFSCLILTPLYLFRVLKVKKKIQILISMVSFIVWVYALGGPFILLGIHDRVIASIILPLFVTTAAIISPNK